MGTIKLHISFKWLLCILLYSLHIQSAAANKKVWVDSMVHKAGLDGVAHSSTIVEEEDGKEFIRATRSKKKTRYYLNASSRQFSINQRIVYPEDKQGYYIHEKETKSGVYQWLDAFLPAYYNFLFRYTLF
jgi:hypothetical protein